MIGVVLNFEDEISLRGVDCDIPGLLVRSNAEDCGRALVRSSAQTDFSAIDAHKGAVKGTDTF